MRTVQNRDAEVEHAVLSHVAAWNETDPDEGIVVSNYETILGRRALFERIQRHRRDNPGPRTLLTSGIEQHLDFFRFTAIAAKADGRCSSPALDTGELDASGRIVSFLYELRTPPEHWPAQLIRREPLI